jgi:hypothetical protein
MSLLLKESEHQKTQLFPFPISGVPVSAKLDSGRNLPHNEALSDLSLILASERSFQNQLAFLGNLKIKKLVFPTYFAGYVLESDISKLRRVLKDLRLWKARLPPARQLLEVIHGRASALGKSGIVLVSVDEYVRAYADRSRYIYAETAQTLRRHINARFAKSFRKAAEIVIEFLAAAVSFGIRIVSAGQRLIGIVSKAFRRVMKTVKVSFPYVSGAKLFINIALIILAPSIIPHREESMVQMATRALEILAESLRMLSIPFYPSSLGLAQGAAILVVCP